MSKDIEKDLTDTMQDIQKDFAWWDNVCDNRRMDLLTKVMMLRDLLQSKAEMYSKFETLETTDMLIYAELLSLIPQLEDFHKHILDLDNERINNTERLCNLLIKLNPSEKFCKEILEYEY